MKVIKVNIPSNHEKNGTCYKTKLIIDYSVPHLRQNVDTSTQNVALRTGLSANKLKERRHVESTKFNPNKPYYTPKSANRPKVYDSINKEWVEL